MHEDQLALRMFQRSCSQQENSDHMRHGWHLTTFMDLQFYAQVAGAWSERQKMFHGGSLLKLADDNMYIQNPEAQNREVSGF